MGLFDNIFSKKESKKVSKKESICRYYKSGTCTAGGLNYNCSANFRAYENCSVWKLHAKGDLSAIY